jgi:DNA-binding response OmpR family regulator
MQILLAGADGSHGESLATGLKQHGHDVDLVRTGEEVLSRLDRTELVLFDLLLPDLEGCELCRRVRARSAVPMIAFGEADARLDRVLVLRAGADDCVVKPVWLHELAARIEAVRRRTGGAGSGSALYRLGTLTVDALRRWVTIDGAEIQLTRKEFELLALLAEAKGAVVTRDSILARVWGDNWYGSTRTLDVHVGALRAKLGDKGWIETVRGVGFRLAAPKEECKETA